MDTMKQMTLNASGVGDLATYRALRAVTAAADDDSAGHDIAVTSGEDGVVYFVDVSNERVLFDAVVCDGTMPALAVVPEQTHLLVVSGDDNELYSYTMPPQFERDALLLRSPVAIRHIACSASLVAVATEDTEIKVLRRAATDEIISVQGHDHGIKSVAFDGTGKLLCSASEDGTVRVFAIDEAALSATQLAMFKVQYGDIRSEQVLARCAWQPGDQAELLAVPVNQGIVELFDRTTWTSKGQLLLPMGKSKSSDLNVLSFSPNGLYVAGATLQQEVFIWSVADKQCVRSFKVDHGVVAVQWAPSQNTLLAFNDGGKLGVVQDAVPMGLTPPHQLGLGGSRTTTAATATVSATVKKPTPSKKRVTGSQFVDDEAMDDGDGGDDESEAELDDGETRVEAIKASFGFGAATSGDADLGLASDRQEGDDDDDDYSSRLGSYAKTSSAVSASPFQTFQEPFQSGSVQDGAVTLLAWTPLGEIECVRSASRREQLVKVEFADKSRRGFKFSDQYLFSMAALDDHGAFFGVPRRAREDWDVDDDHNASGVISSFIFYRPFDSWASNASWHVDLPEGEDAESIACAREFCAVATSLNCLRVYTTSGIAFALVRMPGRVVTLTARGSKLAVVYQDGVARLGFKLLEIHVSSRADRVRVLAEGVVPLTPPIVDVFGSHKENELRRRDVANYATLAWLGFDERGVLIAVDSVGCVQALASSYGYQWFPVGCVGNALLKKPDARQAVFTLGVVNNALLYFPLERGQTAPKLRGKHRPVPLKFPLQHAAFPKTLSSASSGKKGESQGPVVNDLWQHVRLAAIDAHDDDKRVAEQAEMDKSLILMMKAACTNDEPARVLDLAKCLHLEKSHQIAQKLAGHFGFRELQAQLYELYRHRFERVDPMELDRSHEQLPSRRHASSSSSVMHRSSTAEPLAHSMASRPQPRLGRQPKPAPEEEALPQEEVKVDGGDGEAPPAASSSSVPEKENHHSAKPPSVERSVAPVNPFLKKPSPTSSSNATSKSKASGGGLERLANFTSPPPAKRSKPWK